MHSISSLVLGSPEHNDLVHRIYSRLLGVDQERHLQTLRGSRHQTLHAEDRQHLYQHRNPDGPEIQHLGRSAMTLSAFPSQTRERWSVQPDGQVARKSSNVHQFRLHLCARSGNQLEHDQVLDSGNTALLEHVVSSMHPMSPQLFHARLLSVVRGSGQPFDSCPISSVRQMLELGLITRRMVVFHRVVCLRAD